MPERKEQKRLRALLEGYEKGWIEYTPKDDKPIDWVCSSRPCKPTRALEQ